MYPTLCEVIYFNESEARAVTKYALIYADNYVDAAQKMEDYYGSDNIESLSIHMYDIGLWEVSEDEANHLIEKL